MKFEIENPAELQQVKEQSVIRIEFWKFVLDDNGEKKMELADRLNVDIGRLIEGSKVKSIQQPTTIVMTIFALLVGFTFVGSLLIKATLHPFWSFFNSLTILLHLVMLNIQIPAEISYQAGQLIYFSRFSFMASSDEYWALDPRDVN